MKYNAAFFCNSDATVERVYGRDRIEKIRGLCRLYPDVINETNAGTHTDELENTEVVFSTWGMPVLPQTLIEKMGKLRCILYGASSVKYFAEPYLKRGVTVISAAYANGEFVARYAASQIFLAGKNYFRILRGPGGTVPAHGSFGLTVGIIGAGNIGRLMMKILLSEGHKVLLYDPYYSGDSAAEKASLSDIFKYCDIVTNHAPDTPETRGMFGGKLFASMKPGAYFINTGRGASVAESEMARVFADRPDLTALLDVTYPEPPAPDSPLLKLGNVIITPHIAGAVGTEVNHMADYCIEEFLKWSRGEKSGGEIELGKLSLLS